LLPGAIDRRSAFRNTVWCGDGVLDVDHREWGRDLIALFSLRGFGQYAGEHSLGRLVRGFAKSNLVIRGYKIALSHDLIRMGDSFRLTHRKFHCSRAVEHRQGHQPIRHGDLPASYAASRALIDGSLQ
jgi:hypothetical protein